MYYVDLAGHNLYRLYPVAYNIMVYRAVARGVLSMGSEETPPDKERSTKRSTRMYAKVH